MSEVINLAAWCRKEMEKDLDDSEQEKPKDEFSFSDVLLQNKQKQERLARDRAKNNDGVTRQYRLRRSPKNKK